MPSSLTATQQRNAVSEGVALGLLYLGHDRLPFVKVDVDLAFQSAWDDWDGRRVFQQVNTDLHNGTDASRVMTRADRRKNTYALYWQVGREMTICRRPTFEDPPTSNVDEFREMAEFVDGGLDLIAWVDLAHDFRRRFLR